MKASEYFASPAYSASDLLMFAKSPMLLADYRAGLVRRTESPAMNMGTAIHAALLEPHRIRIQPTEYDSGKDGLKPWNNNALVCRAWHDKNRAEDAVVLSERQHADIALMLHRTPSVIKDLLSLPTEQSVFAPFNRLDLRCRCDILDVPNGIIYDVKTIASLDDIDKNIRNYHYAERAEFYKLVCNSRFGKNFEFVMLFVESTHPFEWQIVRLSDTYQGIGWRVVSMLLEGLTRSHQSGDFSGIRELNYTAEAANWQLDLEDIV